MLTRVGCYQLYQVWIPQIAYHTSLEPLHCTDCAETVDMATKNMGHPGQSSLPKNPKEQHRAELDAEKGPTYTAPPGKDNTADAVNPLKPDKTKPSGVSLHAYRSPVLCFCRKVSDAYHSLASLPSKSVLLAHRSPASTQSRTTRARTQRK